MLADVYVINAMNVCYDGDARAGWRSRPHTYTLHPYARMHLHACTCAHTHTHCIPMHACTYMLAHVHMHMHTHTHTHTHTHIQTHIHTHMHACMHARTHAHKYTVTHACAHTHTHLSHNYKTNLPKKVLFNPCLIQHNIQQLYWYLKNWKSNVTERNSTELLCFIDWHAIPDMYLFIQAVWIVSVRSKRSHWLLVKDATLFVKEK